MEAPRSIIHSRLSQFLNWVQKKTIVYHLPSMHGIHSHFFFKFMAIDARLMLSGDNAQYTLRDISADLYTPPSRIKIQKNYVMEKVIQGNFYNICLVKSLMLRT